MEIIESLKLLILKLTDLLPTITISGVIEILIFTYLIYKIINWISITNSFNILAGIFVIMTFVFFSYILNLRVIFNILKNSSSVVLTLLVIVFQNEIRQAIGRLGRYQWFKKLFSTFKSTQLKSDKEITDICRSVFDMAKVKTGALIVIKQNDDLSKIVETGIKIDGLISTQLIKNIFEKNTPLHDGAVVIADSKIVAVTCYLPMSANLSISKNLGTRHRAGLGISEVTDSFTIIVSEERGTVTVAYRGKLKDISDEKLLANEMYNTVYKTETQDDSNDIMSIMKGWLNKNGRARK